MSTRFRVAGVVVSATVAAGLAVAARSATLGAPGPEAGPAVEQVFLDERLSRVSTEAGAVCVASAPIDIRRSRYLSPRGREVPFGAVRRSVAAAAQHVVAVDGASALRVQLKYSPRPSRPILLRVGPRLLDVRAALEPAGDSLRLTDAALIDRVFAAWDRGGPVMLVATSRDTGRRVVDRLPPLDRRAAESCARSAPHAPPEPAAPIGLVFDAAPDPATRIAPERARACRMSPATGPIHAGRLRRITGFVVQTAVVYVTFDAHGAPAQLHIPGLFEARASGGAYAADVSRAADANDPSVAHGVSGCIGSAETALCAMPAEGGDWALGPCVGSLLAADLFDDATYLSDFVSPEVAAGGVSEPSGEARPLPTARAGGFAGGALGGVLSGGSFGGGGGGSRRPGSDPDPAATPRASGPIPIIPAPAPGGLLISGLVLAGWLVRRRAPAARAPSRDRSRARHLRRDPPPCFDPMARVRAMRDTSRRLRPTGGERR